MTWLDKSLLRNRYYKIHHDEHQFENMVLIATTDMTIEEAADQVEEYIKQQIK